MNKNDDNTTIQELKDIIIHFREERGWRKHHNPRNLAISIVVEAAELLEHFQWDDYSKAEKNEVADELSDVLSYCFSLADIMSIDIASAYSDKIARNRIKYPTTIFKPGQDASEDFARIKQEYRARKPGRSQTGTAPDKK